jgi:uncharacterized protein (UPF0548 family)
MHDVARRKVDNGGRIPQCPAMLHLTPPSRDRLDDFLAQQRYLNHSYAEVGQSNATAVPAGYELDHNRVQLGAGELDFVAACQAVREWRMFPAPWTRIEPRHPVIVAGTVVAMLAHVYGFWWLNACRVVYVIDDSQPHSRFGFAYGTLPGHVEMGEERFLVEKLPDGSVWYDLRAFSRPRFWGARLLKPLVRGLQQRFVRDSKASMCAAVAAARGSRYAVANVGRTLM